VLTRARTAIALLFHVLLLQVSVLGGGMACAMDGTAPAAAAHHGAQAVAPHEAAHHEATQHEATHPADAPSHCVTAAGCAAVAVAAPEVTPAALATVSASAVRAPVRAPASTRAAPEPPPPRG